MASDVNVTGNDGDICAETVRPMVEKLGRWIADNALEKTGTPEFREALLLHRQATDLLARQVSAS